MAAPAIVDPDVEEVRLAMALNGGVSLAVWMGGVAIELDCVRRAHTCPEPGDDGNPSRGLYTAVLGAFQRRLVIDILCGASAGGLNGSLLAAAIRRGRRLNAGMLRTRWLTLGDFLHLLQPMTRRDPPSLMQGGSSVQDAGIFYAAVREMFSVVLGDPIPGVTANQIKTSAPPASQGPVQLDVVLDVMMTNVQGEPRKFRDYWGNELAAREYRAPLRFREANDFEVETLATASRASASFPFAFEPFLVATPSAELAGFAGARYGVDGGLLENAPIDAAIRLIPSRSATSQVKRFVCYVNAAPPSADPANPTPPPTTVADVAGWVFNVPRIARFVDQLYAVQDAQRRALVSRTAQPKLLGLSWPALEATAEALLPTYRERRLILALQDIFDDSAIADDLGRAAGPGAALPWLPGSVSAPTTSCDWRWGVRTAERILHLQVDLLRTALRLAPTAAERHLVLEARKDVFDAGEALPGLASSLANAARTAATTGPVNLATVGLGFKGFQAGVFTAVTTATDAFLPVIAQPFLVTPRQEDSPADTDDRATFETLQTLLFDPDPDASADALSPQARFLRRALAVEVIQRAFSTTEDIESGQDLPFAQFTPLVPVRIFSSRPFQDETVPDSGDKKLTGTKLMHFSGFYRSSWRANDFMWGRLDSATRIVDLLIDSARHKELEGNSWISPAAVLAEAILPGGVAADERHALVVEAFKDAHASYANVPAPVTSLLTAYAPPATISPDLTPTAVNPDVLRDDLCASMAADLATGDSRFTRTIVSRALQAEILNEEYRHLTTTSSDDAKDGSFVAPLPAATSDSIASINAIRSLYFQEPDSDLPPTGLPGALGLTDPDEMTSDLALRTLSRMLYATLAMMRRTVVLGRLLAIGRAPLLPFSGMVAESRRVRAFAILGFAAAASYITMRLLTTTPRDTSGNTINPDLGALWNPAVLLSWIAVLVLLGTIIVPGLRAIRASKERRRRKVKLAVFALALLAFSLVIPLTLASREAHFGIEQLLGTPGAAGIPHFGTKAVLLLILGTPAIFALVSFAIPGENALQGYFDEHVPLAVLLAAVSALVLGWSAWKAAHHLNWNWRAWTLLSASAALVIFAIYVGEGMLRRPRTPLVLPPI